MIQLPTMSAISSMFRYEWKHALTSSQFFSSVALTLIPVAIVTIACVNHPDVDELRMTRMATLLIWLLIPMMTCLLQLLLGLTNLVNSELEGRSWIYYSIRPGGRTALLLGKYLSTISRTTISGWIALSLVIAVLRPYEAARMWAVFAIVIFLSCMAYGALYAFIGSLFPRRATVVAVSYTLLIEFLVSFVPAVINELTIQRRLRTIYMIWMKQRALLKEMAIMFSDAPSYYEVLILIGITLLLLTAAALVMNVREYAGADQEAP